jgi:hypothetical protein
MFGFATAIVFSFGFASTALGLGIPAPFGTQRDPSPPASSSVSHSTSGTSGSSAGSSSGASNGSTSSFKALWEGHNANAAQWTADAQDAIAKYAPDLIKGSNDIATFCPMYDRLGTQDRINFWVQLIAAMTKYESGFNPASRMIETTMGNDPITGKQTASEGLLQLSYSDAKNYRRVVAAGVCAFDYSVDKQYAVTDIRRTILDPKTNLACGIGILNRQIQRDHLIAESSNAYWAVIKTNRSSNKLSAIRAITKALSFCN